MAKKETTPKKIKEETKVSNLTEQEKEFIFTCPIAEKEILLKKELLNK